MERNLDLLILDLKNCLSQRLFFAALDISLTIPDICSALESNNGQTDGNKYMKWVDTYFAPKYNGFINGSDIWKLRCASLHQGKINHDKPKFDRIIFQIPNSSDLHCNIIGGNTFVLNIQSFVNDMIKSRSEWIALNMSNKNIAKNYENCFKYQQTSVGNFIG